MPALHHRDLLRYARAVAVVRRKYRRRCERQLHIHPSGFAARTQSHCDGDGFGRKHFGAFGACCAPAGPTTAPRRPSLKFTSRAESARVSRSPSSGVSSHTRQSRKLCHPERSEGPGREVARRSRPRSPRSLATLGMTAHFRSARRHWRLDVIMDPRLRLTARAPPFVRPDPPLVAIGFLLVVEGPKPPP